LDCFERVDLPETRLTEN